MSQRRFRRNSGRATVRADTNRGRKYLGLDITSDKANGMYPTTDELLTMKLTDTAIVRIVRLLSKILGFRFRKW
jgi:hypothetical protein